jgi:hypothetical protein
LSDPNTPDSERWSTSQGSDYYPYVRTLGGVSLFDFDQFDAETYSNKCPSSSWGEFVPYRRDWGCAVWIEIDRKRVDADIISGPSLVAKWKADNAYRHKIMPYIEAAYLGPLAVAAFKRAFQVSDQDDELHPLGW